MRRHKITHIAWYKTLSMNISKLLPRYEESKCDCRYAATCEGYYCTYVPGMLQAGINAFMKTSQFKDQFKCAWSNRVVNHTNHTDNQTNYTDRTIGSARAKLHKSSDTYGTFHVKWSVDGTPVDFCAKIHITVKDYQFYAAIEGWRIEIVCGWNELLFDTIDDALAAHNKYRPDCPICCQPLSGHK